LKNSGKILRATSNVLKKADNEGQEYKNISYYSGLGFGKMGFVAITLGVTAAEQATGRPGR
jgi:preprotein translocase subunit Sss1